ncbi:MAG: hypothetical protein Q4G51_17255 [Dermatophilus congolensis]|nr:hypothetical protein [Dermatophilus congolensis]
MSDEPTRGRRIVKAGRRRAVSRPTTPVETRIDPTLDDLTDSGGAERGSGNESREESRDDWLQEQRPPHWE